MPQVMSEEEAQNKYCPLDVRARQPCIGSKCMGWDWSDGENQSKAYQGSGPDRPGYEKEQIEAGWTLHTRQYGDGKEFKSHWTKPLDSPRKGFCGMVPQVFAQVEVSHG